MSHAWLFCSWKWVPDLGHQLHRWGMMMCVWSMQRKATGTFLLLFLDLIFLLQMRWGRNSWALAHTSVLSRPRGPLWEIRSLHSIHFHPAQSREPSDERQRDSCSMEVRCWEGGEWSIGWGFRGSSVMVYLGVCWQLFATNHHQVKCKLMPTTINCHYCCCCLLIRILPPEQWESTLQPLASEDALDYLL
jgi:hypothetical protein